MRKTGRLLYWDGARGWAGIGAQMLILPRVPRIAGLELEEVDYLPDCGVASVTERDAEPRVLRPAERLAIDAALARMVVSGLQEIC